MPYTDLTTAFLEQANAALAGSPYSFPDDERSRQRIVEIRRSVEHVAALAQQLKARIAKPRETDASVVRIHRTQEVYESNAIEGVGLDINQTHQVLNSLDGQLRESSEYVEWALLEGLRQDPHEYEVIGLDAARSLARDLAQDLDRPIAESDLRSLHRVIMGDAPHAGRYKRYHVQIAGSGHVPPAPTDTPAHVEQLVAWVNGLALTPALPSTSIIQSAAVHAWFAHIHPFEDGNGRVARLIANLVLTRQLLPPLIIRNKADRGRYIDALGESDSAGDLTRLVLGFSRYLERTGSDYNNPRLATRVFQADIKERHEKEFVFWDRRFAAWLAALRAALPSRNLTSQVVGGLSAGDFEYLRRRNRLGNSWLMKVFGRDGRGVLVWIGFPSDELHRVLEKEDMFPTIFLSVQNTLGDGVPYVWVRNDGRQVYTDFMLEPRTNQVYVYGRGNGRAVLDLDAAADEFASAAFSFIVDPPNLSREYVRGLHRDPDLWTP